MSVISFPQPRFHQHIAQQRLRTDGQTLGSSLFINLATWLLAGSFGGLCHWLSGDYRISVAATAAVLIVAPLFWARLQYRRPARAARA